MLSVIIPARNEPYLQATVNDLLAKARGDVEITVVLDGYWPDPILKDDKRLRQIHYSTPRGMRNAINSAVRVSKGEYLLKCDAHCMFDQMYDEKLIKYCEPTWVVVPVRYTLNPKNWTRDNRPHEFQYIRQRDFKGKGWPEYAERVNGEMLCDLMTTQGSCWFMHKKFFEDIGGLDEKNFGTMGREAQEVCLKTWLSGGRFVLSRHTWYAHWSKPVEYVISARQEKYKSSQYILEAFKPGVWPKQTRSLEWLIQKFSPVPTW